MYDEVNSLAALRTKLGQELDKASRQRADAVVQQEILKQLVAVHPIEVPDVLLNEELRRAYLQHKHQESEGQLTEADYYVAPENLREPFGEQALETVRGQLILRHIATAADLTVDPTEVEAEVVALAARTHLRRIKLWAWHPACTRSISSKPVFAKIMAICILLIRSSVRMAVSGSEMANRSRRNEAYGIVPMVVERRIAASRPVIHVCSKTVLSS